MRATRAIIHLDKFAENLRFVRERVGRRRLICAVVKADAYGHGAVAVAQAGLAAGADFLAVATVGEGEELREAGLNAPLLLLSQPLPDEIPRLVKSTLTPIVSDGEYAGLLEKSASAAGIRLPVHLKTDTGMNRMGCAPEDAPALARLIASCRSLKYEGTATHFAAADSDAAADITRTEKQLNCFRQTLSRIQAAGIDPGIVHAANSGAVMLHPDSWFDMVRPGILLYGYDATKAASGEDACVKPVMELRTRVVFIKPVKKGQAVSYGGTWTAPCDTEIAVLSIGYADGLPRLASDRWQAVIGGKAFPLAGRICMDQCMIDIGSTGSVRRWDEAVLFGGGAPGADELAERTGTIPYEITCNISKRVPRVWIG